MNTPKRPDISHMPFAFTAWAAKVLPDDYKDPEKVDDCEDSEKVDDHHSTERGIIIIETYNKKRDRKWTTYKCGCVYITYNDEFGPKPADWNDDRKFCDKHKTLHKE